MSISKKITVGGLQINNGFSGQFYLPYSIGILYAYLLHNSQNPERYKFKPTNTKNSLLKYLKLNYIRKDA